MTGAVVSCTFTEKLPWLELPAPSVAVQFTVVVPIAKVLPELGEHEIVGFAVTASVAVAANVEAAPDGPVASFTMLPGTVRTGAVVSTTLTLNVVDVAELLCASFAVHVTVVDPSANRLPDAGAQDATPAPS